MHTTHNRSWLTDIISHTSNILYRYVPLVRKVLWFEQHLTLLMSLVERRPQCSLINATWAHILAVEVYTPVRISPNCANHCVMVVYGRRGEASGAVATYRIPQQVVEQSKSWTVSFFFPDIQLIMPSCVSRTAGNGALTVPVLITGKRAPERWDASWHLGLILTSINTSRGSLWSDYRREWWRNRNVGKQGGLERGRGGVRGKGRGLDI